MKQNQGTKDLAVLLLVAFFLTTAIFPVDAFARWHSRSDELPGYSTSEMIEKAAVIGGISLAVVLLVKAAKNKAPQQTGGEMPADAPQDSTATSMISPEVYAQLSPATIGCTEEPKLVPYVDLLPAPGTMGYGKGGAVSVGLTLHF